MHDWPGGRIFDHHSEDQRTQHFVPYRIEFRSAIRPLTKPDDPSRYNPSNGCFAHKCLYSTVCHDLRRLRRPSRFDLLKCDKSYPSVQRCRNLP